MNDAMARLGDDESLPPIGYLINVVFKDISTKEDPIGFEVYKVPRGKTIADAEYWEYFPENVKDDKALIIITPKDLGIDDDACTVLISRLT